MMVSLSLVLALRSMLSTPPSVRLPDVVRVPMTPSAAGLSVPLTVRLPLMSVAGDAVRPPVSVLPVPRVKPAAETSSSAPDAMVTEVELAMEPVAPRPRVPPLIVVAPL